MFSLSMWSKDKKMFLVIFNKIGRQIIERMPFDAIERQV